MGGALQQAIDTLPARAVHDTVAAIIREGGYGRTLTQSLLGRFLQFVIDRIAELLAFVRGIPSLRLLTIGITLVVVVAIFARIVTARRLRDELRRSRAGRVVGSTRVDPWVRAQALAREGRYTEAVHALYAAVIDELAAAQSIRVDSSKTSGDYARELRRAGSPVATAFRSFARRADRAIYGLHECTVQDFESLVQEAQPLIPSRRAA
jgi:hypothetical protein